MFTYLPLVDALIVLFHKHYGFCIGLRMLYANIAQYGNGFTLSARNRCQGYEKQKHPMYMYIFITQLH